MKKRRILILSPDISVQGGISTVIRGYLSAGLSKRHKIYFVSSHVDGTVLRKFIQAIIGLFRASYYLLVKQIDIIHIHGGDPTSMKRKFVFYRLAGLFSCKIIYHFHGASFMELYPQLSGFWKKRLKTFLEGVAMVVCLSESWKNNILSIAPTAKITVVPNSVSLPVLSKREKRTNVVLRLAFLGQIGERKGLFDLLKVVEMLISKGIKVKLFVGGDGEIDRLKTEVELMGIEGQVEYLGWVSPKGRDTLLRNTDLFVLPSYGEGMPMAILEAMAYAVPIISTFVGGIPELVINGETGYLVNPGDKTGLYQRIVELATDNEKRYRFGLNARRTIERHYDITDTIKKIDSLYNTI